MWIPKNLRKKFLTEKWSKIHSVFNRGDDSEGDEEYIMK